MLSNSSSPRQSGALNPHPDSDAVRLSISLISVPSLLAIVLMRSTLHHLEQLGVNSEEIFRGDRLPILPFPDQS